MDPRYARNIPALTEEECRALWDKRILVVGCGGLGGHIIDQLARIGVGFLRVVDGDVFEASNLNRQLLSRVPLLGTSKAKAAADELTVRYGDKLNILQNECCIDIVRLDVNKAVGIYKLLEIVGAKYEDVITVGDNYNDADMIREFRSYAMDNAVPLLKELADATVPGVTELIYRELGEK